MRYDTRWLLAVMVMVGLASAWYSGAQGQTGTPAVQAATLPAPPSGSLQVVSRQGEPTMAIVYDTEKKVLGVYHIDSSGGIELKGIRPIRWDLEMLHYNGKQPLPEEIRDSLPR